MSAVSGWWRRGGSWGVKAMLVVAGCLTAIGLVIGGADDYWTHLAMMTLLWSLIVSGLNLTFGYAGQLNLALGAFFAIGAYGAVVASRSDWNGLLTILLVVLVACLVGVAIGLVSFRAQGFYFAFLTAGFSLLAFELIIEWRSVTGGLAGAAVENPFRLGPWTVDRPSEFVALTGLSLMAFMLSVIWLQKRGLIREWEAIREDETLAASLGVRRLRQKILAFVVGGAVAAFAGVIYAYYSVYVSAEQFDFFNASFQPVLMLIIGGSGTLLGPIVGAVVLVIGPELLRFLQEYRELAFALLLAVMIVVAPRGVVGSLARWLSSLRASRTPSGEEATGGV